MPVRGYSSQLCMLERQPTIPNNASVICKALVCTQTLYWSLVKSSTEVQNPRFCHTTHTLLKHRTHPFHVQLSHSYIAWAWSNLIAWPFLKGQAMTLERALSRSMLIFTSQYLSARNMCMLWVRSSGRSYSYMAIWPANGSLWRRFLSIETELYC